jgi:hypothetical protein
MSSAWKLGPEGQSSICTRTGHPVQRLTIYVITRCEARKCTLLVDHVRFVCSDALGLPAPQRFGLFGSSLEGALPAVHFS